MILDEVHSCLQEKLLESGFFEILDYAKSGRDDIIQRLTSTEKPVHGLVVRSKLKLDSKILNGAKTLQWIARAGSGQDGIDVEFAQKNNITLIHASEGNRLAVAEHVTAMILAWFNRLVPGHQQIQDRVWDREGTRGLQLAGTTVGLIGYGHNGSQTARILAALGCRVLVYEKYRQNFIPGDSGPILETTMDQIRQEAEVLTLHIPLAEDTYNLVRLEFLAGFRRLRLLVNAARGPIVSLPDLIIALDQNLLQGACLDTLPIEDPQTWDQETMNKILAHPGLILSPHVAGWTVESYRGISEVLAHKIITHHQQVR
jgi:D-3-phosphoglycerate dehydrogenase